MPRGKRTTAKRTARIAAVATWPETPPTDALINQRTVLERLGNPSRMTLWRMQREDPQFPKPTVVGHRNLWSAHELSAYIQGLLRRRGA
jgi:predicted DNA-binding transcriptional regulator AlpA